MKRLEKTKEIWKKYPLGVKFGKWIDYGERWILH
jgi:hypothetical protein